MTDEPITEPTPAMPPEPSMSDVMACLLDLHKKVDNNSEALIQLQNRVIELHSSASKDVAGVRSRLFVVERRLGLTPVPGTTNGTGAPPTDAE